MRALMEIKVCQKCGREAEFAEHICSHCGGNIIIKYVSRQS